MQRRKGEDRGSERHRERELRRMGFRGKFRVWKEKRDQSGRMIE